MDEKRKVEYTQILKIESIYHTLKPNKKKQILETIINWARNELGKLGIKEEFIIHKNMLN